MQPLTREALLRFAPAPKRRSDDDERPAIHEAYIATLIESWPFLVEQGFTSPQRLAPFLATAGHETGGFTIVREHCVWSWSRMCELWPQRFKASDLPMRARYMACRGKEDRIAELAYGGWNDLGKRLGNKEDGDGYLFRGGSWLQGTGRSWYREAGDAIGVDLENAPEQIADPKIAIRIAVWYWRKHKLHDLADRGCYRAIQNQINRGNAFSSKDPIGWDSRQRWLRKAWDALGDAPPVTSTTEIAIGASGSHVKDVQLRLRDLGYPCGKPDGIWGPESRRAMAAFKADWCSGDGHPIEAGDVVGPQTLAALSEAKPISRPEREKMTEKDLAEAGSTEVAAGQHAKHAGRMSLLLGGSGAAVATEQANPGQVLDQAVGWVPGAKATMVPVIESVQWGLKHFWWVAAITLGVWVYLGGLKIIRARLDAARRGLNLWR